MSIEEITAGDRSLADAVVEAARTAPAGQLVAQANRLLELAQQLQQQAVAAERARGTSWDVIGTTSNTGKSNAHAKFSKGVTQRLAAAGEQGEIDPFPAVLTDLHALWGEVGDLVGAQWATEHFQVAATAASRTWDSEHDHQDQQPSILEEMLAAHTKNAGQNELKEAAEGDAADFHGPLKPRHRQLGRLKPPLALSHAIWWQDRQQDAMEALAASGWTVAQGAPGAYTYALRCHDHDWVVGSAASEETRLRRLEARLEAVERRLGGSDEPVHDK
ncbi:hypothetical protein [Kitasatospora purpeofusca]|uniref:hypothetical protein n=1 Tax=Kitasatospora purpeofusca TaxID=67352 RepID=UPI003F4ADEAD